MIVSSAHRPALGGYWEHPLVLAALMVAVVLATAVPIALGVTVDAAYAIGSKIVLCGLAVVLLTGLRWWRRAGFLALPGRRDLAWLAPRRDRVLGLRSLLRQLVPIRHSCRCRHPLVSVASAVVMTSST